MSLIIVFVYIAIIPIVLIFCKFLGIEDRFIEGEEYLESINNEIT